MASLWAVTKGDYSDYRVLCICDTKERAEEIVAIADPDGYYDKQIEEMVYLDRPPVKVTTFSMQEEILDDGTTERFFERVDVEWEYDMSYTHQNKPVYWRWVRAPYIERRGGRLEVGGTDLERVRKVFSDRKAMLRTDDAMRSRREIGG